MQNITIRQRTREEGLSVSCPEQELPYIIEIDGKKLENVRKFELTLENAIVDGGLDIDNVATYSVTHYGMTYDDLNKGYGIPVESK